jgi:hypothetical protein
LVSRCWVLLIGDTSSRGLGLRASTTNKQMS